MDGNYEDAKFLIEHGGKKFNKRPRGRIAWMLDSSWRGKWAENPKTDEEINDMLDFLAKHGADAGFNRNTAFKNACSQYRTKVMKKFMDDFGMDPHMDGEMPMRRVVEGNIEHNAGNPKTMPGILEAMQLLLDYFKKGA